MHNKNKRKNTKLIFFGTCVVQLPYVLFQIEVSTKSFPTFRADVRLRGLMRVHVEAEIVNLKSTLIILRALNNSYFNQSSLKS